MDTTGMTPQEKETVLQFMGQTYGESHKQDQMIVGESQQLRPQSNQLKQQFEHVLRTPAQAPQQQNAPMPAPVQGPVSTPEAPAFVPAAPVSVEQAARELAEAEQQPVITPHVGNNNQLELDLSEPSKLDKLIDLTKQQNLLLEKISLKLDNGKRTKVTKKG